jgi:hypothetical protein
MPKKTGLTGLIKVKVESKITKNMEHWVKIIENIQEY